MIRRSKRAARQDRMIKALDDACRKEVLERDGKCQRCGAMQDLQWSHVHSRRHHCIRWDLDNSKALCRGCHCWWTNHPIEAAFWFSRNWPMRWERINELLRRNPKVNVRELYEAL